jgi:LuxR family maltose regulon positive regulatory protein
MAQASHQSEMLLLKTKLAHPPLKEGLVLRERLLKVLDMVFIHRLALLSASAGSGKTTLLSTWANRAHTCGKQVAWLSLDEMENDSTRFWASVITALRLCLPGIGEAALHRLHSPQSQAILTILTMLINEILEQGSEVILILDDYHLIENTTIHEAIAFLFDHLPANLHLVLASRVDPDLPLARWRARGQMLEIHDTDMHFTLEEAKSFLSQALGFPASAEEVDLLKARTEGWIVGLQLAALALHKHHDRAAFLHTFSGSHRYLMDYVQQEILKRLPLPLQQFLLRIAVLPRMNAELCRAVTGESSSQEALEFLERNNLFLVPLDSERQWYRLHDLFREVLLARLHTTQPEQMPQLRLQAACWHEQHQEFREAIAQALAAGDFSYAATLMESTIEEIWLHGEFQTLYRWIMALPDAVVREHARLVLTAALYLLNSSASIMEEQSIKVRGQVERMLSQVEVALKASEAGTLSTDEGELLQRRSRLLRFWIDAYEALRTIDVKRFAQNTQAIQQLDEDDEPLWQMIPLSTLFILHHTFLQEGGILVPKLEEAKLRVNQTRNHYAIIKVMQWLVMTYSVNGQLRLAYQECLAAEALLQHIKGHDALAGYFSLSLGDILYQWNRLEEMWTLTQEIIQDAVVWQRIDLLGSGYLQAGFAAFAAGDLDKTEQVLEKGEHLMMQEPQANIYKQAFMELRILYWLATGDLAKAGEWASSVSFHEETLQINQRFLFLMWAWILCAQQRYSEAIEALDRFIAHFNRAGDVVSTLTYLAISVVALRLGGKRERAQNTLIHLLQLTEQDGWIRLYLDRGEPMRQALQELFASAQQGADALLQETPFPHAYVLSLLAAFEQEPQRRAKREVAPAPLPQESWPHSPLTPSPQAQPALIERLSPQEQRVLRLLVTGRTYAEIAQELIVSLNTIKTQVSSIYRKLGVSRRAEAIELARTFHLF